jgi:general secretion pathway protein H
MTVHGLRARTLPQGMSIASLRIEGMRPQGVMRLVFAPDGLAPAFSIEMSLGREHYTLAASPVGELRVLPGADDGNGAVALR